MERVLSVGKEEETDTGFCSVLYLYRVARMKVRTIPRGVAKAHSCRGSVQRGIQRARVGVREPSLYRGVVRRTHYYRNSDVGHPYTFESSSAFGTQRNRGVDRVRSAAQSTETELGRKDDDNGEGERFIDIEEFDRMHGMTFEDEINSGVAGKTLDSTSSFNDGDSGLAMELSFAGLPTHSDNVEGSNSDRAINSELTNDSSIPSTTTESILSQDQSPSSASVPPMWSSRAKRKGFRNKEDMFELAFTLESKQNDEHWEDLLAGHELSGRDWVKIFPLMSEEKRGLAKTIELFDYLKNETSNDVKNVYAFTTMINCCASHLDEETINRFLVEMNELDIIPTAATYTAILKCIKDRPKRIEAMVDMMKKNGYELNLRTYTTYITSLGRRGKWQKALELFQMLKKDGHVPNQITYGAIVAALAKSNKLDMAMDIFEEMLERGLQPNVQIYTSLIHCCRFSGEWKQALELFSEMVEDDELKPDVITYTALICTCLQAGEWKESLNLYTVSQTT